MSTREDDRVLIVLVGPAAAGKSTTVAALGLPTVSSDALRELLTDDAGDQSANEVVFDLMRRVVEQRCARGLTTVVDATNLDPANRRVWLTIADAHRTRTRAVRHGVPLDELLARNATRARHVPGEVVRSMDHVFRTRCSAEQLRAEGFDEVLEADEL